MTELIPAQEIEVEVQVLPLRPLTEFERLEASLAALCAKYEGAVYDCSTREGEEFARAARRDLRGLRYATEKTRVAVKAPHLDRGRLIDATAARITAKIVPYEEAANQPIEAEEARRAAIKEAAEQAERDRVARIRGAIAGFSRPVTLKTSRAQLEEWIGELELVEIDESCEEFVAEAKAALDASLTSLRLRLAERIAADEEAARVAAEKAELAKAKAEQAEKDAAERARLAREREEQDAEIRKRREALEAEEKAAREARAEADRKAAAQRAEDDRLAREKREAAEKRIADERAEIDRVREVARLEKEAEAAAEIAAEHRVRDAAFTMLGALKAVRGEHDPFFQFSAETQALVTAAIAEAEEDASEPAAAQDLADHIDV